MCFGGSKKSAPKQQESPAERRAAREAMDKWQERKQDGYVGLEKRAIADSRVDHTALLQGRGGADIAQQEAEAYGLASPGRRGLDFGEVGSAVATSGARTNAAARNQGLQIRDAKTLGVIRTGQDMANNSANAVMAAAQNGFSRAATDVQYELERIKSRNAMIGKTASTAGAILGYKAGQKKPNKTPVTNAQSSLGWDRGR